MGFKKLVCGVGAVAFFASATVLGIAGPAAAAPSITVTPNTDLKDGDKVEVVVSGFSPNAPVAVGVCPTGRALKGAGDCGPSKEGASKLLSADASGKATATMTVIKGSLGNLTPPKATCPPCSISAANIANAKETATTKLNYASSSPPKTATSSDTANAADTADTAAAPEEALPKTGPRETAIIALLGFLVLQAGLVLAVRASRSAPRRTTA